MNQHEDSEKDAELKIHPPQLSRFNPYYYATNPHVHFQKANMKTLQAIGMVLLCLLSISCASQKALWIDVKGDHKQTSIAVTEAIARKLLDTREPHINFMKQSDGGPITREMLQSVLDGREQSITARGERGSEVTMSMKPLTTPGGKGNNNRLVLETRKAGEQKFRIALPELDIELAGEDKVSVTANLDWKSWLPFLAKEGGAVYIKDHKDDTEVWVYVE
ncbi:MAG: hypothetical protein KF749_06705 [Bacteroidetes bacterium]|nr:hypothetical protein [Bacteroidota bacterium]MCW5896923.1 hypothetical protein [Bacteroidota bacterium]